MGTPAALRVRWDIACEMGGMPPLRRPAATSCCAGCGCAAAKRQ